jgi:hypothetical protein
MNGIGKGIGGPVGIPRMPKQAQPMHLETPNYSQRSPIVNDNHFVDGNPPVPSPVLGSPQASFDPGAKSSALPNGPPRFIQPQGAKRVFGTKGLTNKRQTSNI